MNERAGETRPFHAGLAILIGIFGIDMVQVACPFAVILFKHLVGGTFAGVDAFPLSAFRKCVSSGQDRRHRCGRAPSARLRNRQHFARQIAHQRAVHARIQRVDAAPRAARRHGSRCPSP